MKDIKEIMADPTVHNLTKYVIALAMDKDPVDAYYDVQLALDVIRERMEAVLNMNSHISADITSEKTVESTKERE